MREKEKNALCYIFAIFSGGGVTKLLLFVLLVWCFWNCVRILTLSIRAVFASFSSPWNLKKKRTFSSSNFFSFKKTRFRLAAWPVAVTRNTDVRDRSVFRDRKMSKRKDIRFILNLVQSSVYLFVCVLAACLPVCRSCLPVPPPLTHSCPPLIPRSTVCMSLCRSLLPAPRPSTRHPTPPHPHDRPSFCETFRHSPGVAACCDTVPSYLSHTPLIQKLHLNLEARWQCQTLLSGSRMALTNYSIQQMTYPLHAEPRPV